MSADRVSRWWQGIQLSEEEEAVLQTIRDVNEREFQKLAREIDLAETHSDDYHRLVVRWMDIMRDLGLWGLAVPEEFGGPGFSLRTVCLVVDELSTTFPSGATSVLGNLCATSLLAASANRALTGPLLEEMAKGTVLGGFALTEPGAGSDTSGIRTRGRKKDGSLIIDGEKCFITNSGYLDFYCVFCVTQPELGSKGTSVVLVEKDRKGFEVVRLEDKMGLRGSPTGFLTFQGVDVPEENVVAEGRGLAEALRVLTWTRIATGAMAAGIARGAFDRAAAYDAARPVFGASVLDQPVVRYKLADMWTRIEAARSLVYRAADCFERGEDIRRIAAAAKLYASDVSTDVTQDAVQLLGGYGYLKDYDVERAMRDTKVMQIFDGANEVLRTHVVARDLFGRSEVAGQ